MDNFETFELPHFLRNSLKDMGINIPTPIQVASIPFALDGRDILASAETGSGKTIAYALPIITNLMAKPEAVALILAPTRELVVQVKNNLKQLLGEKSPLNLAVLIGGEEMRKQFDQLKRNPKIIIGTPGRICDHLNRKSLKLNNTSFLVLDETDRMLDMGFSEQLEYILQHVPSERQTFMFSATMPVDITKLSQKYLINPERVQIGEVNKPAASIKQRTIQARSMEKFSVLVKELGNKSKGSSAIVFVKTKRNAQEISDQLCEHQFNSEAMHGDLSQRKREKVIKDFRNQRTEIIVATDIAARGLDVPHIEYVFNYHLPESPEDYIHRIGRTGRAGAEGHAISLVAPEDYKKWQAIDRLIHGKNTSFARNSDRNKSSISKGTKSFSEKRRGPFSEERRSPFSEERRGGFSDEGRRNSFSQERRSSFSEERRGSFSDEGRRNSFSEERRGSFSDEGRRNTFSEKRRGSFSDEGRSKFSKFNTQEKNFLSDNQRSGAKKLELRNKAEDNPRKVFLARKTPGLLGGRRRLDVNNSDSPSGNNLKDGFKKVQGNKKKNFFH